MTWQKHDDAGCHQINSCYASTRGQVQHSAEILAAFLNIRRNVNRLNAPDLHSAPHPALKLVKAYYFCLNACQNHVEVYSKSMIRQLDSENGTVIFVAMEALQCISAA